MCFEDVAVGGAGAERPGIGPGIGLLASSPGSFAV